MTPEYREQLRIALLRALNTAAPYAMPASELLVAAKRAGLRSMDQAGIDAELEAMRAEGFCVPAPTGISAGIVRWLLAHAGRNWLVAEGFQ